MILELISPVTILLVKMIANEIVFELINDSHL